MATDVEIDRAVAAIAATLNDQRLEHYDCKRVQELVTGALGGSPELTVDDGGGIHDEAGTRVGAIRQGPDSTWIVERQNDAAQRSQTAVPTPSKMSLARKLLTKLKVRSG
jgi:hypothetical protein